MIIQSKKVWIADQFTPAQLELEDGIIKEIYPYNEKEVTKDYGDLRILPGFIDIHCHGAYGFDTNYAYEDGLRKWTKGIVDEGVTSFLATTLTQSEEVLTKAVSNVAKVVEEGYEGAEILGIHFEGPYLNKERKGAHPEEYCVKADIEQFKRYQNAAHGLIKYMTMAVENDEDFSLIKYCSQNGVVVSIGHSNATYEQAVQAYAHGARSITHVFNAMSPFTHRENGLVGAGFRIRNMYSEINGDGNHVTLAAINNFFASKGPDYGIMITDSLMCKGFPVGSKFDLGGQEVVIYPDGSAHLVEAGNLAGSTLKMNKGLQILIEDALVPVNYAINACTSNPARCLHVDDRKGTIGIGYDADLVVLDKDYEVVQTYCKGIGQK